MFLLEKKTLSLSVFSDINYFWLVNPKLIRLTENSVKNDASAHGQTTFVPINIYSNFYNRLSPFCVNASTKKLT
jgi:hypothetical protein